jgi:hypothetical protein
MKSLGHRILEVLQASSDGHATALNVFNVLNRDGYNVTKQEFEAACERLHGGTCITYQPIRTSLIDIPIGTLDLLAKSPVSSAFSEDADLRLSHETMVAPSAVKSSMAGGVVSPVETCEAQLGDSGGETLCDVVAPSGYILTLPILLAQAWRRARASSWFNGFAGFSFRF